jgi:hypothetical protein
MACCGGGGGGGGGYDQRMGYVEVEIEIYVLSSCVKCDGDECKWVEIVI